MLSNTTRLLARRSRVARGLLALRLGGFLAVACALVACKSSSPSQYVSPRITGRVLDGQTHQPIKGARVRRLSSGENARPLDPPKGGQLMEQTPVVRSGADGTFVLESVRDLAVFRRLSWYSVSVAFERAGYERFVTNYTLGSSTNTAKGEPLVNAGDILLRRFSSPVESKDE